VKQSARLDSPHGDNERRRRLIERLRAECIAGAEAEWRKQMGWPMTRAELERELPCYPLDV